MNNKLLSHFNEIKYKYLIILSLIFFGIFLSFVGGYGSDEDTLPMIATFTQRLLDNGQFVSSRFTGYPVPEIGIGFLAYYLGSWAANVVTFSFFLIGIFLFYFSQVNEIKLNKSGFLTFFILCLSSPILFFDNIEPIDYSWAFLFYSLGLFSLSRNKRELAVLFFAFCIGCRINFLIFILFTYFLINIKNYKFSYFEKTYNFLATWVLGGLFYLPVWFYSAFKLDWLTAARPLDQGYLGLLARFLYKTNLTFGIFQSFLIIFLIIQLTNNKKFLNFFKSNLFIITLIISNLFLFFYIPAELSYMQPALIFFYYLLVKNFNQKILYLFVSLNFLSWFINFDYLKINYEKEGLCDPKNALSASLNFSIEDGYIKKYFDTRNMINCWVHVKEDPVGKRILEGKSLKEK